MSPTLAGALPLPPHDKEKRSARRGSPSVKTNLLLEFEKLQKMAKYGAYKGLEVHAGHGLTLETVAQISGIMEIEELNIGHSIISDSIFVGMDSAVRSMREKMEEGRH